MNGESFPEMENSIEQGMRSIFCDQEFAPLTVVDEQIIGASFCSVRGYDSHAGCGVE